eukprot:5501096-Prymnesium_polylepis.2
MRASTARTSSFLTSPFATFFWIRDSALAAFSRAPLLPLPRTRSISGAVAPAAAIATALRSSRAR